ncbi:MAG: RluA family pseudouridine synthase [Saprospiraceae bacterium]
MKEEINAEDKEFLLDDPEFEKLEIVVDPGQNPIRIDQFIFDRLSQVSRNKIQNAIIAGLITVNDKPTKANYKIRPKDILQIVFPKPQHSEDITPENIPLHIIYEDDDLMIVNKEPGMVVHPAVGNYTGTLVNALAYYFNQESSKSNNDRYGLVHRIDKETSGLLVVAKNEFAVAHISKQFFDHSIEREYVALVWGEPSESEGTITGNIGRDPKQRQRMYVFEDGLEGKHAVTHYELLESFYYTSLIKCKLETGRTHQIRVHLKHIGHTLFNDEKYGGDRIQKGTIYSKYKQFVQNCYKIMPRFALHARSIGLIHPRTLKKLNFEIDIPNDFQVLLSKWRNYSIYRKDIIAEDEKDDSNSMEKINNIND